MKDLPVEPVQMHSWQTVEQLPLFRGDRVTGGFLKLGIRDLRSAARFIGSLPYKRNSDPRQELIVLKEIRGTCSTKHAVIRRLAVEQGFDIALVLGIYEMTERNTPGVGEVLANYGLTTVPEAHCYIRSSGKRIDLTRANRADGIEPITRFLYEEDIEASQIASFKVCLHMDFIRRWIREGNCRGLTPREVWRIREECIAALEKWPSVPATNSLRG